MMTYKPYSDGILGERQTKDSKQLILWFFMFLVSAVSMVNSNVLAQTISAETGVWGKIDYYSNEHVQVDGRKYEFSKTTTMDTYSLKPDQRGNVRVVLDAQGRVARLYFYGIDMPDVIRQFRR